MSHWIKEPSQNRSSHRRCLVNKGVLKNFAKFAGKHLYQSLFFNKVAGLRPLTILLTKSSILDHKQNDKKL